MQERPKISKNILVLSYGPVPTPEFQKIEGGGMRCWGLATGLRDNGHNVTVGVYEEFKQNLSSHEGIGLYNWSLGEDFKAYINSFDAVIVSYSMGDMSVFVADNLSHHITLVLDCYVPIYIEISARDSEDKVSELRGYLYEVERFNHVLKRGDYFLCANEPQKHMYMGILGSLGVINPYSYRQHRVLVVPFGVENKPDKKLVSKNPYKLSDKNDFVLLWFGGLYPWFNFKPLIKSVEQLSKNPRFKFYLVGGRNPYNGHPDFIKQYDYVHEQFTKMGLVDKSVFFVDWVDYNERARWYTNANVVISINQPGEENIYSWRTRVMDYLWGELPMVTNGGDPLSDELINRGSAVSTGLSSDEIVEHVNKLMDNPAIVATMRKNLSEIKKAYHWNLVTKILSDKLASEDNLPFVDNLSFIEDNKIRVQSSRPLHTQRLLTAAKKARKMAVRAKKKGLIRSGRFAASIVVAQANHLVSRKVSNVTKKAIFLSHPINHTGAPLVLMDLIDDFGKNWGHKQMFIVAPNIERDLRHRLLTSGYKIRKMAEGVGGRIIQAGLQVAPDDFVLMNTSDVYTNYKIYLFWLLETERLNKAYWFIHEDDPELHFENRRENSRISRLINSGKLHLLVPSSKTAGEYNEFFETNSVKPVTLRVDVDNKYCAPRPAADFNTIKFFMSGNPLDGRKGQLLFLAALQLFETKYRAVGPDLYRPYTLDLVAIGKDYISEQIKSIGHTLLGEGFHTYPKVSRDEALKIASSCNVTVCASLNETFALFVAEGMLMGHPVLRNDTSGWQEQIKDGVNGFKFETLSVDQLADRISKILSKDLSNQQLQKMSKASQSIAEKFKNADYYKQIFENSD